MAVMISVQPEWVDKIVRGEKIDEIRKSMPKCTLPTKVYIYCTKGKKRLYEVLKKGEQMLYAEEGMVYKENTFVTGPHFSYADKRNEWLGRVIGEFTLNSYERFDVPYPAYFHEVEDKLAHIVKNSCLSIKELHRYLGTKSGYALRIDNLKVYDKPKELNDFKKQNACYKNKTWIDRDGEFQVDNCFEHCPIRELGECDGRCSVMERPPQSWCFCEDLEE